jgi:hypothetical protein
LIAAKVPLATVTLTARYLDQLKSHGRRYEVFDAIVPRLAIRVSASLALDRVCGDSAASI